MYIKQNILYIIVYINHSYINVYATKHFDIFTCIRNIFTTFITLQMRNSQHSSSNEPIIRRTNPHRTRNTTTSTNPQYDEPVIRRQQ